ncbi:MAG: hypothetical protein ACHP9Z_12835 [Streptosporangiales bacterium]
MSASDAAPLPRLGEVFFDVRGNSRSMRLSWYADTGVAVFSIWQGGTCTGTFRLPMDDLARMIEALRRGPKGQRGPREVPGEAAGGHEAAPGRGMPGAAPPGPQEPGQATVSMRLPAAADGPAVQRPEDRGEPAYRRDSGGYPADPLSPDYRDPGSGEFAASGEFPAAGSGGYPDVPATGDYRRGGVGPGGYPGEPSGGYRRPAAPAGGYPADPGYRADPGYPDVPATGDYRRGGAGRRPEDAGGFPEGSGYPGPGYPDGPATGDYRPGSSGSHRRGDPGYPADPEEYRRGQAGSHRRDAGGYPGDPAYPADSPPPPYSRQPGIADYPGEPGSGGSGGYPAEPDYEQHGDEWDDDTADQTLGGYGAAPPPESHPYGRPPANRDSRERGRYPGRH